MSDKAFTTFQISKICKVTHRTVLSWINQGKIKAFKTPGGHSRVNEKDLKAFLIEYNIPLPESMHASPVEVLVVDDEKEILFLIKKSLCEDEALQNKIIVNTCENGLDAMMHIGKSKPGIIVLDVCLPNLNGYEVCERIRSNPELKDVCIIAISGQNLPDTREKILSAGAHAFLAKPFEMSEIKKAVKRALTGCLQTDS
jgi:excisionase family DNA binding protein